MVFNPYEITGFITNCFAKQSGGSQGNLKLISFFSLCVSVTFCWGGGGGNVSLLFILLEGKIKDQKTKFGKYYFCLKDNATSGFKLEKNICLDI